MAQRPRNRRPMTSPSSMLPTVPEHGENRRRGTAPSHSSEEDQGSVRSLPTEYGRSYRILANPRPRNPVDGWQTRNVSNILPFLGAEPSARQRPIRRPSPHSLAKSQVFPEPPPPPPKVDDSDANNNPENAAVPVPHPVPPRQRRIWPWQARAQASTIFMGEYGATTRAPPIPLRNDPTNRHHPQWPWQERAKKSVIYDILRSQEPVKPPPKIRSYVWDQRKTTLIIKDSSSTPTSTAENVPAEEIPPTSTSAPTATKHWPWQERAQRSVIFLPPDKPLCSRQIKYVWDQRHTRFTTSDDPCAKFPEESHYTQSFVPWEKHAQDISMKPAGKPCYHESDDNQSAAGMRKGKRAMPKFCHETPTEEENLHNIDKKRRNVITCPASDFSKWTQEKEAACLDIVPMDYEF